MTWIVNLRNCLPDNSLFPLPSRIGRSLAYYGNMVKAATSRGVGKPFRSAITCSRRPGHKPCKGKIMLLLREDGIVEWECESCDYNGLLSGWQDTMWDLRKAKRVAWYDDSLAFAVSEEEYRILLGVNIFIPDSRAVVAGAMTTGDKILIVARKETMESLALGIHFAWRSEMNKKKAAILEAIRDKARESMGDTSAR